MKIVSENTVKSASRFGRAASATVNGVRRSGFLVGNRFVFSNSSQLASAFECLPGEFKAVKIWRH